jgi:hypothetical protein
VHRKVKRFPAGKVEAGFKVIEVAVPAEGVTQEKGGNERKGREREEREETRGKGGNERKGREREEREGTRGKGGNETARSHMTGTM